MLAADSVGATNPASPPGGEETRHGPFFTKVWWSASSTLVGTAVLFIGAWLSGVEMTPVLTFLLFVCLLYLTAAGLLLVYYCWPSVRRRREFRGEARALEAGVLAVAGMYETDSAGESEARSQAYTKLHFTLRRIRRKFRIRVPVEPFEYVLQPPLQDRLAELAGFAETGDVEAARRLFEDD